MAERELNPEERHLRDQFAGQALMGMIASDPIADRTQVDKPNWAKVAYAFADAMLAARKESDNG